MKKNISAMCLCLAVFLLMASLFAAIPLTDHDCEVHDCCSRCLLIQFTENLLRALWLFALIAAFFLYLHSGESVIFHHLIPLPQTHPSPVALCDKLSN